MYEHVMVETLSGTFNAILGGNVYIEVIEVRKRAKIRNLCNQAPHLIQDTDGKVATSQLDITNESQEASPFPAGHKASTNRRAIKHNKTRQKSHK